MIEKPVTMVQPNRIGATDLEMMARECANLDPAACEIAIAEQAMRAIQERRIDDAVFWQRVKFRSRLLRAMARGRSDPAADIQQEENQDDGRYIRST